MSTRKLRPLYVVKDFDRPMRDYWGVPIPRRVRIGRLAKSLERLTYDRPEATPFLRALERSAGLRKGEEVNRVTVALYQEGLFQWVLQVHVTVSGRRRLLCLTVAKDASRYSKLARREHGILKTLRARNAGAVVSVLEGVEIPLVDDRYGGTLAGYFSHFLTGFTELGIDARHRFALVGQEQAQVLSVGQSEAMRARMLEVLASLFDPKSGSALVDLEVNSGDFMGKAEGGRVDVRLIAARNLRSGFSLTGLLRALCEPMGEHAEKPFFLVPEKPEMAVDALLAGLSIPYGGEEAARSALRKAVQQGVRKGTPLETPYLTWNDLKSLL
jgi:hypothetical protein